MKCNDCNAENSLSRVHYTLERDLNPCINSSIFEYQLKLRVNWTDVGQMMAYVLREDIAITHGNCVADHANNSAVFAVAEILFDPESAFANRITRHTRDRISTGVNAIFFDDVQVYEKHLQNKDLDLDLVINAAQVIGYDCHLAIIPAPTTEGRKRFAKIGFKRIPKTDFMYVDLLDASIGYAQKGRRKAR